MDVEERVAMASKFKAQCLALLDQVARTKIAIVITEHGKPVTRLAPLDQPIASPTMGSVRGSSQMTTVPVSPRESAERPRVHPQHDPVGYARCPVVASGGGRLSRRARVSSPRLTRS
ncbi:MAG: type II toxin-antitoxin system Phd/YefM family antitoxin [Egibacteraceae bacterium]